jgi:hypothetical protein
LEEAVEALLEALQAAAVIFCELDGLIPFPAFARLSYCLLGNDHYVVLDMNRYEQNYCELLE